MNILQKSLSGNAFFSSFSGTYKRKLFNALLHPLMIGKFRKVGEKLLDNWQKAIENTNGKDS